MLKAIEHSHRASILLMVLIDRIYVKGYSHLCVYIICLKKNFIYIFSITTLTTFDRHLHNLWPNVLFKEMELSTKQLQPHNPTNSTHSSPQLSADEKKVKQQLATRMGKWPTNAFCSFVSFFKTMKKKIFQCV